MADVTDLNGIVKRAGYRLQSADYRTDAGEIIFEATADLLIAVASDLRDIRNILQNGAAPHA